LKAGKNVLYWLEFCCEAAIFWFLTIQFLCRRKQRASLFHTWQKKDISAMGELDTDLGIHHLPRARFFCNFDHFFPGPGYTVQQLCRRCGQKVVE
jgi:hypothetical protein